MATNTSYQYISNAHTTQQGTHRCSKASGTGGRSSPGIIPGAYACLLSPMMWPPKYGASSTMTWWYSTGAPSSTRNATTSPVMGACRGAGGTAATRRAVPLGVHACHLNRVCDRHAAAQRARAAVQARSCWVFHAPRPAQMSPAAPRTPRPAPSSLGRPARPAATQLLTRMHAALQLTRTRAACALACGTCAAACQARARINERVCCARVTRQRPAFPPARVGAPCWRCCLSRRASRPRTCRARTRPPALCTHPCAHC